MALLAGSPASRLHNGRAACPLHLGAGGRRLPHGKRAADAGRHHRHAAVPPDGPGPGSLDNQPNHLGAGGDSLARRSDTATAFSIPAAQLHFLVRSNNQSSVAAASFTVRGLRHGPECLRLEHRARLHPHAAGTLLLQLPVPATQPPTS